MISAEEIFKTLFYLGVALGALTFLHFVLDMSVEKFISTIMFEMGMLASKINSQAGLNALVLIMMFILIVLFYVSYLAREVYEILRIVREGVSGEQQQNFFGLFVISLLGGAGLLSTVVVRR